MTSVYPVSPYGSQPPMGGYTGYGIQSPPTYDPQQPSYYASAPGTVPPQGYPPPQGYYPPPGSVPPTGYYAPPGSVPPPGYAMPQQGYAPVPGAAFVDPVTGNIATPFNPVMGGGYPPPNGTAVAIPIAQPVGYPVPMQVAYGVPPVKQGQNENPMNQIEKGRWSAGLCDCCNSCMPNLCMSCCCPCVALAQIYARIALGRYYVVLARLLILTIGCTIIRFVSPQRTGQYTAYYDSNGNYVHESEGIDTTSIITSVVYIVLQIAFAIHVLHARMHVRQRFQIPGNGCCDLMISCYCSCCAIAQMATHVKSYKPGNCSLDAPDVLPPFN